MPNYRFINRYKTYQENRKIMRPNFKNINITTDAFAQNGKGSISCNPEDKWITPELIPVKPIYTQADLEGMEHLNYVAGIPPGFPWQSFCGPSPGIACKTWMPTVKLSSRLS